MNEHYYTREPKSAHDPHEVSLKMRGVGLSFLTDAGVFAKRAVDHGTWLLLDSLPLPLVGDILDVGCGYGALGLTVAAVSPRANLTLVDVNHRALELSKLNAKRNGTENVQILESDGLSALLNRQYDWVLTNPPVRAGKQVIYRIFHEAHTQLRDGGQLWIVMRKKQGAPSAVKALEPLFLEVNIATRDKGYQVIRCKK